jgi:hypothetical protein
MISGNARADWMPSPRATSVVVGSFVKSAGVRIAALPVLNALPTKGNNIVDESALRQ